jgi:hypothetical protein
MQHLDGVAANDLVERLVVEVDEPAWATQLKFLETDLRARLQATIGATVEHFDIRVKRR